MSAHPELVARLSGSPRVAWVGVGAVGLLYSARLARGGVEVHLLLRSDYDAAVAHGITVKSVDGDFRLPPPPQGRFAAHRSAETVPPVDLVVISTKTTANADLPGLLRPFFRPGRAAPALLTLQNGMGNEAFLASHFPDAAVVGATAFVSVHRTAPATVDHQHSGYCALGRYGGPPDAVLEAVAGVMRRTGFGIEVLPSLAFARWEKQLWNVPFNGLGGALNADTQVLLSTPQGRELVLSIMREVCDVSHADGHPMDHLIEPKIRYTEGMGAYRTSMQLDREHGRAMEIDSIIGSVRRLGTELGVETPLLDTLQLQLHAIDTK